MWVKPVKNVMVWVDIFVDQYMYIDAVCYLRIWKQSTLSSNNLGCESFISFVKNPQIQQFALGFPHGEYNALP